MTWHLRAYVIGNQVAHVYCSTEPIDHDNIKVPENCLRVSAEIDGEYQHAGVVFPSLTWDGATLGGVPVVSQEISPYAP